MKINIIGGGAGGLLFAILMKKMDPSHQITLVERDGPQDTFGWGVVFSQKTMDLLRQKDPEIYAHALEATEDWDHVTVAHQGEKVDVRGNVFYGIRRLTFLNILHERALALGVDVQFHTNVTTEAQLDRLAEADLLVGADGANSLVRRTYADFFLPSTDLRQNKFVWLGTAQPFSGLTLTFRETGAGLFIAHSYRFSQTQSTFIVEVPPDTWTRSGLARMSEEETLAYLADVFQADLGGQPLLSNNFLKWTNFLLVKNKHWSHGHIALLGDACHTVHFSIGSGTKLAMEDAVALARAFADQAAIGDALQAYERARKPMIDQFQDAAVQSLTWLENIQERLDLPLIPFAYGLVTRSNRVGFNRLKRQAPDFIARYEEWREQQPSSGPVPREFLDLFQKVAFGHLATLMPDGTPHVTSVYVDYDGQYLLVNSTQGRQKARNMERRPEVSIEIPDPDNPNRYLGIRGRVVEITQEGADEHLDRLAQRYLGREKYPPTWRYPGEIRCIFKIEPLHVIGWEPFG